MKSLQISDIYPMIQNKVLFIGLVWPEPTSSAAGKRILQLVDFFLQRGDEVIFCSAASKSEASFDFSEIILTESLREGTTKQSHNHVSEFPIELNSSSFNEFIQKLQPNMVVYDRFVTEEQFGWRVRQECPESLQILDTEDLHFLRAAREKAYKKQTEIDLYNETTFREIAAILRCDLSLLISDVEKNLLVNQFKISPSILHYIPFLETSSHCERSQVISKTHFEQRKDFVFIGNFIHEPNWQTVLYLKKVVWPKLRKEIPSAQLHIYGAYPTQKVWDLHHEKEGFWVHGKAENAIEIISQARILLAPLPFGAGQKGKFIDAMQAGTPIATNSIGAESMFEEKIPGIKSDDLKEFIEKTVDLYQNETIWNEAQLTGFEILKEKFDKDLYINDLNSKIQNIQSELIAHRHENFIGQILQQNNLNALKYMSLWIEEKNKK
jgi:glycosyltransferase involved in cell wall biosynthesis